MSLERYWRVAVDAPISEPLTYLDPSKDVDAPTTPLRRGRPVIVPLGRRRVHGVILDETSAPKSDFKLKPISDTVADYPDLTSHFIDWLEWVSNYYMHPIGQVMQLCFPPLKKVGRQRKSEPEIPLSKAGFELADAQRTCIANIESHKGFATHLLFGITGSGKTEVYLQLLEKVLARGETGLVLVPEISLTPQLVQRFQARFGNKVAALHSKLTEREKTDHWWDIVEGRKQILIGARSALFCPIPNLGLIVVDEEHEQSFKQEEKLKYHARDSAIMLARFSNCPIVLGSATPSLESWKNAQEGRFHLHPMPSRVGAHALPEVHIVDLRELGAKAKADPQKPKSDIPFWMSPLLHEKIIGRLEEGEQTALFLNRRGMAQVVLCPLCGYSSSCPNCAVTLTLHSHSHLICHYCDYHQNRPTVCPDCKEGELRPNGLGTELIEQDLAEMFPNARLRRADRDEIQSRRDLEDMIASVEAREVDILIGTQMIAKGLDFPHLTLVGIVLADIGIHMPDFRASERSFQLLTQVSGRSGRHQLKGEVVLQTYNPDHPSIQFALQHDYAGFAHLELETRLALRYPPYGRLGSIRIQGVDLKKVKRAADQIQARAQALLKQPNLRDVVQVLGPAEAPLAKLRGKFRYHLLIKAPHAKMLTYVAQSLLETADIPPSVKISVDIDPVNML